MKLFCASSTSEAFKEGEWYDATFYGDNFSIKESEGKHWTGRYDEDCGFIVINMVGGDFVEFE